MYNNKNTREAELVFHRMDDELARQGKTQAALISKLDLPRGTYSAWKAGKSRNFCEHLGAIAEFLNISAVFLVTGKEAEKNLANPREEELLLLYRELNPEKQGALRLMAKLLSE